MSSSVEAGSSAVGSVEAGLDRAPMRADARRNREALLNASAKVFAERGPDASLEEIARQAGVGIGTLYRHFPDRDALTEAVYRNEVERLCDRVDILLAENAPDVALGVWMRNFVTYAATKRGMLVSLKSALGADNELFSYSQRRIRTAIETLVKASADAGSIRRDIDAEALLTAMRGLCMAGDVAFDLAHTMLLIDVLVDGLRYRAQN